MAKSVGKSFSSLLIIILLVILVSISLAGAQNQTVGLFLNDTSSFPGYTLFCPDLTGTPAYLIDHYGRLVHSWDLNPGKGGGIYLLENGQLLWAMRMGGVRGCHLFKYDWDGNTVWEWEDYDTSYIYHHDIEPLPNGNVLVIARDFKSAAEADAAGRDTSTLSGITLWSEKIFEVEPSGSSGGNVVWEWRVWDHLIQDFDSTKNNYGVVEEHPELMDINYASALADWLHANSVAYNAELDQIILSFRSISEIWVIDHSTSTAEAAGHTGGNSGRGGDILYRWGNPEVYRAGDETDKKLFSQHNAHWIKPGLPGEGSILVFNNGNGRNYSSIDEIVSTVDENGQYPLPAPGIPHGPTDPVWTYVDNPPESFYAWFISGAERMQNGNTLICNGPYGEFREVTSAGDIVWRYISPVGSSGPVAQGGTPTGNSVFRCTRYAPDYPGLAGQDLTPMSFLETYPITVSGTTHWPAIPSPTDTMLVVISDIYTPNGVFSAEVLFDTGSGEFLVNMYDDGNHQDGSPGDGLYGSIIDPPSDTITVTYYVRVKDLGAETVTDPPNPPLTVYRAKLGFVCGNIDGLTGPGGPTDISDLSYLVDYLFKSGPPPPSINAANVDGIVGPGGPIDITDLSYLVDYLFKDGPEPSCPE